MPREPFCQIATKAAKPTRIESPAQASAPKNVASAGFISRKPKRTMKIETSTATTREHREIARPGGEAGHGLRLIGSGKPAGHRFNSAGLGMPGQALAGPPFETTALRQIQGANGRIGE